MDSDSENNRASAYFWVMLGTLMFAVMFIIPKHLGDGFSPVQVTFFRYLSGFLTICPVYLFRRRVIRAQAHAITGYGFHLSRAFFGVMTTVSITYAVTHIPLANANAINMTSGMFAALFAVMFLGERLLVIVNGAASLLLLGPALYLWRDLTMAETGLLMLMGPIAIIGQYFNILGFRQGNAINVSVIRYTGIFFAAMIGIAFFNEWPTATTIIGSLMIFAGAFAMLRFGARR